MIAGVGLDYDSPTGTRWARAESYLHEKQGLRGAAGMPVHAKVYGGSIGRASAAKFCFV